MHFECRIEPIIDLKTGNRIGGEILCAPGNQTPESFFSQLSDDTLRRIVEYQLDTYPHTTDSGSAEIFMNISAGLLCSPGWFTGVAPRMTGIALEIDYRDFIAHKHLLLQHAGEITALCRAHHIRLWLDDFNDTCTGHLDSFSDFFTGIKVDKYLLWRMREENNPEGLGRLVSQLRTYTGIILTEGVESPACHRLASNALADRAQGYIWPAEARECFSFDITDLP